MAETREQILQKYYEQFKSNEWAYFLIPKIDPKSANDENVSTIINSNIKKSPLKSLILFLIKTFSKKYKQEVKCLVLEPQTSKTEMAYQIVKFVGLTYPCNNDASMEDINQNSETGESDNQIYENPDEKELVNDHQSCEDSEDTNDTTSECDDSDEDYYPPSYKPPTSYSIQPPTPSAIDDENESEITVNEESQQRENDDIEYAEEAMTSPSLAQKRSARTKKAVSFSENEKITETQNTGPKEKANKLKKAKTNNENKSKTTTGGKEDYKIVENSAVTSNENPNVCKQNNISNNCSPPKDKNTLNTNEAENKRSHTQEKNPDIEILGEKPPQVALNQNKETSSENLSKANLNSSSISQADESSMKLNEYMNNFHFVTQEQKNVDERNYITNHFNQREKKSYVDKFGYDWGDITDDDICWDDVQSQPNPTSPKMPTKPNEQRPGEVNEELTNGNSQTTTEMQSQLNNPQTLACTDKQIAPSKVAKPNDQKTAYKDQNQTETNPENEKQHIIKQKAHKFQSSTQKKILEEYKKLEKKHAEQAEKVKELSKEIEQEKKKNKNCADKIKKLNENLDEIGKKDESGILEEFIQILKQLETIKEEREEMKIQIDDYKKKNIEKQNEIRKQKDLIVKREQTIDMLRTENQQEVDLRIKTETINGLLSSKNESLEARNNEILDENQKKDHNINQLKTIIKELTKKNDDTVVETLKNDNKSLKERNDQILRELTKITKKRYEWINPNQDNTVEQTHIEKDKTDKNNIEDKDKALWEKWKKKQEDLYGQYDGGQNRNQKDIYYSTNRKNGKEEYQRSHKDPSQKEEKQQEVSHDQRSEQKQKRYEGNRNNRWNRERDGQNNMYRQRSNSNYRQRSDSNYSQNYFQKRRDSNYWYNNYRQQRDSNHRFDNTYRRRQDSTNTYKRRRQDSTNTYEGHRYGRYYRQDNVNRRPDNTYRKQNSNNVYERASNMNRYDKRSKDTPCWYYEQGFCRYSREQCNFKHEYRKTHDRGYKNEKSDQETNRLEKLSQKTSKDQEIYNTICKNIHQPGDKCYLGNRCRYQHNKEERCRYDIIGKCKKGSECPYEHRISKKQSKPDAPQNILSYMEYRAMFKRNNPETLEISSGESDTDSTESKVHYENTEVTSTIETRQSEEQSTDNEI